MWTRAWLEARHSPHLLTTFRQTVNLPIFKEYESSSLRSFSRLVEVGHGSWLHRSVKQKNDASIGSILEEKRKSWYAKLTFWEKIYFALGGLGGSLYLYSKIDWDGSKAAKAEEEKAAAQRLREQRLEALPAFLQGKSFAVEEENPLEGASPAEINALVKEQQQRRSAELSLQNRAFAMSAFADDPYEGLTPEEIDALVAEQGPR